LLRILTLLVILLLRVAGVVVDTAQAVVELADY
jgi:hypothetical protein